MANPIIKILRGSGTPPTLEAGRIAIDQLNKNLYVGISDGAGGTINEIVGGSGTFATKAHVSDAITAATGSLGTMSTQNADAVAITGGTIDGVDITNGTVNYADMQGVTINAASSIVESTIDDTTIGATTPSTGKFTTLEATDQLNVAGSASFAGATTTILNNGDLEFSMPAGGMVQGLRAPSDARDATNKQYVDGLITNLGSVFRYIGDVSGTDLDALSDTTTGAYYRVNADGTYTASGGYSVAAKTGDAFVKTTTGWQKLDNVDAEVLGTANEIVVTGDENAGYAVAIAEEFKTRVSDVESKTQNIDPSTSAGSTIVNGQFFLKGDGINHAFSITSSGEVSIGAPGQDIYLDRPTYVTGDLSVNGNITDATIDGGEY